jgi:hypothetical protein
MFDATLSAFAAALADPAAPPPFVLERCDPRRFAVYRNNIAAGLIGALEARFPVTRRLVGDDFFRGLAGAFIAAQKPASAVMIAYGAQFPAFVRTFPPARELPYLPDVAALENAWVEAYHSAEAEPLTLAALAEIAPERWESLRFKAHPAARLLRFASPAASLWAAHQGEGEPASPDVWAPEDVLIARPEAEVSLRVLPPDGHDLFAALRDCATLGEAAVPMWARGDDPGPHLVGFISAGALISFG